jgi:hypothetical protein
MHVGLLERNKKYAHNLIGSRKRFRRLAYVIPNIIAEWLSEKPA